MMFAVLLMVAGCAQSKNWDVYSVNSGSDHHSVLLSFSIGYPKGWTPYQYPGSLQRGDIYNDIPVGYSHFGPFCSFVEHATNTLGFYGYDIWLSSGPTARAAAEKFIASTTPPESIIKFKSLNPVKTNAGDSGWLVESTGNMIYYPGLTNSTDPARDLDRLMKSHAPGEKIPTIYHDYFFRSENKGAIRIEILTATTSPSLRSDLDQLVLQTLRF